MGIPLADLLNKVCTVEAKLKECCDSVKKQEGIISDHVSTHINKRNICMYITHFDSYIGKIQKTCSSIFTLYCFTTK